jgi:hypothetical protein
MVLYYHGKSCLVEVSSSLAACLVLLALTVLMNPQAVADTDPAGVPVSATPISVAIDVRPGLCPNHIRVESLLTVPIAILGTADFEVSAIDLGTVRLSREGLAGEVVPAEFAFKDVGSALVGGRCACHQLVGDGLNDLEMLFSIEDLVAKLGLGGQVGESVPLTVSGKLYTGEAITGADCALVISGPWAKTESGEEIGILGGAGNEYLDGRFKFTYFTDVSDRLTFAVYDLHGRVVAKLADMDMAPGIYNATWDGRGANSRKVPAGTYFARVSNSWTSDLRKITVPQ